MKYWYTTKHYCCELTGENCGDAICFGVRESNAPNCDICDTVEDWKASGLTKEKFRVLSEEKTYH